MRNLKKFLALVLATLMVLSVAVFSVSAADEADYTEAANQLAAFGIMKGNENGDLMLANGVTRYQAALFFVQALTGKTDTAVWNAEKKSAYFADVPEYGTAIDYAYGINLIKGRGNGEYGYNDPITYQDMLVMAVRALGYETADMSYPYGYILAADKIGITNVDLVNYKAALTRGETAQIIFDMLNATVARIDPLTDKVLYEDDNYVLDSMNANDGGRTTLLVKSGLAGGSFKGYISAFNPANEDDEESYAEVVFTTYDNATLTLKAADLGITEDTAKVTYLGKPVEVFVSNADIDEFRTEYEEGEAKVVFAKPEKLDSVVNLGDAGNIKYVEGTKNILTLGSDKFDVADYTVVVAEFGEDGWTTDGVTVDLTVDFAYDAKEKVYTCEDASATTYAGVEYTTVSLLTTEDDDTTTDVDETEYTDYLFVYYTPYKFGQFNTVEAEYDVTGKAEVFPVIGVYNQGSGAADDDATPYVVEYYVDDEEADPERTVAEDEGEVYLATKFEGEEVKAGDFMFYAYNEVDNIVTVAKNCGTIQTGRVTATSPAANAETAKINGKNYSFGFTGLFGDLTTYASSADSLSIADLIGNLEAGKDNIAFLAIDDNIVLHYAAAGDTVDANVNFAVIDVTVKGYKNIGIDLDKDEDDNLDADLLTAGVYVENGYVVVPMVNLTTGKYEAAKIGAVATTYDDAPDAKEYGGLVNVASLAETADYATLAAAAQNKFDYASSIIATGLVAVVDNTDGVYTIGSLTPVTDKGDDDAFGGTSANADTVADLLINTAVVADGLTFSATGRTNFIDADSTDDVAPYRVTTGENTVIVAIIDGDVQVRTGMQTDRKNLGDPECAHSGCDCEATFYAASNDLIVLETSFAFDGTWGQGSAVGADAAYYVVLPSVSIEYGTTDTEGEFTATVTGLFDLKTNKEIESIELFDEAASMSAAFTGLDAVLVSGNVATINDDGELVDFGAGLAGAMLAIAGDDYEDVANTFTFTDEETVGGILGLNVNTPITKIEAEVVTVDLTDLDWADYNTSNAYVAVQRGSDYAGATAVNGNYKYALVLDTVKNITKPTAGVLNQFILDMANDDELVYVQNKETKAWDTAIDVDIEVIGYYDDDTQVLSLKVVKTLTVGNTFSVGFYATHAAAMAAINAARVAVGRPEASYTDASNSFVAFADFSEVNYWAEITNGTTTYGTIIPGGDNPGLVIPVASASFNARTQSQFEQWPAGVEGIADGKWTVKVYDMGDTATSGATFNAEWPVTFIGSFTK